MADQFLSSEVSLLHEEYLLGPYVKTYQTHATVAGKLLFWMLVALIVCLLGVMIFVIVPLERDLFTFLSWTDVIISFLPWAFIFLILGFFFWVLRTHDTLVTPIRRKIVVSLYVNGLRYQEGRKQQTISWEQLRSVQRLGVKRGKKPEGFYKLKLNDISEIDLKTIIHNVNELGDAVEREMIKRQLPRKQVDYVANKPVVFPGICLNRHWISKSDEKLRWCEIEQITIGTEKLVIKAKESAKNWLAAPIAQFPNICVLEALLESIKEEYGFGFDKK